MKKRILAIMLACFMIVSLLPMNVFAADTAIKCPGDGVHTAENCTNEVVKVVAPACNNWGYTVYRCLGCDELFADDITENKGDHVMKTIEAVEPVCDPDPEKMTNGVVGGEICSICGWFDTELYPVAPGTEIVAEHDFVAEEGATCLTGTTFNCTKCEATYTTEAGEHVWAELPIILEDPNEALLENGWAIYQCTLCEAYSEKIPVLHHECEKYAQVVPGKAPTCTEAGALDSWKCTVCDRQYAEIDGEVVVIESEEELVIEALGHKDSGEPVIFEETIELTIVGKDVSADEWQTWVAPYDCELTITSVGKGHLVVYLNGKWELNLNQETDRTAVMELKQGDVLAFKNYQLGTLELSYAVEPSLLTVVGNCQNTGSVTYTCEYCGQTITEEVTGEHDLIIKSAAAATCTSNGYYVIVCEVAGCTYNEYKFIPALGHTEAEEPVELLAPTCTEKGLNGYVCETCGELLRTEEVDALGHTEETVTEEGNCVTEGFTWTECSVCGEKLTEKVSTGLGEHVKPEDIEDYVIFNDSTCTKAGNCLYWCTACEYYVEEVIPAKGHDMAYYDVTSCGFTYNASICVRCENDETANWEGTEVTTTPKLVFNSLEEALEHHSVLEVYTNFDPRDNEDIEWVENEDGTISRVIIDYEDLGYLEGREPHCTISALHEYYCNCCDSVFIVVEPALGHVKSIEVEIVAGEEVTFDYPVNAVVVYENGLTVTYTNAYAISAWANGTATVTAAAEGTSAVEPTCTESGATESYTCALCFELVESEEIPALGHTIDEETATADKAPTCEEDGSLRGGYCETCGKWFHITTDEEGNDVYTEVENAEALIISKLGHAYAVIDSWMPEVYDRALDIGFVYAHVRCANCGDEYIINFHRHNFVLDAELSTAPSCTEMGTNVYVCSCGFSYEDPVQPLGHRDENGALLENICANKGEKCAVCEEIIEAEHVLGEWAHVDANCQNGEYKIAFCQNCDYYEVNPLDEELGDHDWSYESIIVDGVDTGKVRRGCTICGKVEIVDADAAVKYTVTIGEDALVIGSELAVTITLSGNTADVWGFDIDVNYNNESLKFLRHEFGTNFSGYTQDNEAYVSVAANADGSAIVTEEVVIVLYFEVIDVIDGEITITHNMTTDPELNKIDATTVGAEYDVSLMMDYNDDGEIDLLDVQGVYNYIAGVEGFEYSILGDVDMDGDIDLEDLTAIYLYIVG